MRLNTQRVIDRYLGIPLCALLSLLPSKITKMPRQPRGILVILLSEMGSLVLAAPLFEQLRTRYPNTSLYILLFAKNQELLSLLEAAATITPLTLRDETIGIFIADSLRILWRLRCLPLDAVLDCELFARVSSLFARLSGAAIRVGFHPHTQEGLYRGDFINRPVLYNPYLHLSWQLLNLAEALESTTRPLVKRQLMAALPTVAPVRLPSAAIDHFFTRLHHDFPTLGAHRLVLIYPGGGILPFRAWPHDYYQQLCQALLADGLAIGIIGLRDDRLQAQRLQSECASLQCLDLTGYTRTIRELLILFQRAALLITNDGGPGQFSALTSLPTIVLFGPETPKLYAPLSPRAHCFFTQLACAPCVTAYNHRHSPCDGDNRCLQEISPAVVLAKARQLLAMDQIP